MSSEEDRLPAELGRRAIILEVGGFRPPDDPMSSWFGRVGFAMPGEGWPESRGKPMLPLCQINLTELPFRPSRLDDVAMIVVFVGQEVLSLDTPNGEGWCLRAYPVADELVPIAAPARFERPKPFPMRPRIVEADFPCWEDVPVELPKSIEARYYDLFDNERGLKLGGWPSLIQAEIFWAACNKHPAVPEYVFQIDSEPKARWAWGDGGVGYFGRGTAAGYEDAWTMAWQCY